jgi:MFS family permease
LIALDDVVKTLPPQEVSMAFQQADSLNNRTFVGLIVAQFLAGFNDQAIHASAMFYAIHKDILTEARAISLMPILFYAPWAIFCTISGYLADRYSKTVSLVVWKFSEVIIAGVALAGFLWGMENPNGAWLVLSTVFLMGTHAAFFAPAKYGAMPEILQPHILSRGNGILESTTFLAAILGTVTGGLLSHIFHGQEYWIGVVLVVLSLIGSGASLMIAYLPPANPSRLFPTNLFKPLVDNLKVLFRSRPLALAVVGIAFFIFMVAYMRQVMYMHGETRVPRWNEFHTSLVVATVALGVGLGSPLAGYLSGGKIELGLVPLGCLGMIAATLFAAFTIQWDLALIASLIVIGFFSGFYMVPLYTLLQHRAPKTTKGDLIATSNFINVVGAMAASVLFFILVYLGQTTGMTPLVEQMDRVASGTLEKIEYDKEKRSTSLLIERENKRKLRIPPKKINKRDLEEIDEVVLDEFEEGLFEITGSGVEVGKKVVVSKYTLTRHMPNEVPTKTVHYRVRPADLPMRPIYDNQGLPRYLFMGAGLMTLGILILLWRRLPDFFVRSLFWFRSLGRFRLKAVGMQNLPSNGPVILATNCTGLESTLQLLAVTDRYTTFLVPNNDQPPGGSPLLRLVVPGNLVEVTEGQTLASWTHARDKVLQALSRGNLVALPLAQNQEGLENLLLELRQQTSAPIVPVFCGLLDPHQDYQLPQAIRVVFGKAVSPGTSSEEIRQDILKLGEWIRQNDSHVLMDEHH